MRKDTGIQPRQSKYLNKRAVCVEGIEVIIEDSFANDVQSELTEAGLHVYWLFGLGCCLWGQRESLASISCKLLLLHEYITV